MRLEKVGNLVLCVVMALTVLWADSLTPLGVADGMLYSIVILLALFSGERRLIHGITAVCILFLAAGYFLSHRAGVPEWIVLTNRGMSLLTIVITAILALKLHKARQKVKEHQRELEILSVTDITTGVFNRRRLNEILETEYRRMVREGTALSILMIDVDYFKRYNDNLGHQMGDQCIRQVARAIQSALQRPGDLLGRYGGDEFTAILPNTDKEGALVIARTMIEAVEKMRIAHPESQAAGHVTISVGGATHRASMGESSVRKMINAADTALYRSKQAGRNTAVMMEGDLPTS